MARALHEAIRSGDLQAAQQLIDGGMDVNYSGGGEPPIFTAVDTENLSAIRMLASAGADLNFINSRGCSPLYRALTSMPTLRALLEAGAAPDLSCDDMGWTAMHRAVRMDKVEAIRVLALAGADVNAADLDGATPLHHAAERGLVRCIETLLDEGAMVNVETRLHKSTPLSLSRARGWVLVTGLLDRAADDQEHRKIP